MWSSSSAAAGSFLLPLSPGELPHSESCPIEPLSTTRCAVLSFHVSDQAVGARWGIIALVASIQPFFTAVYIYFHFLPEGDLSDAEHRVCTRCCALGLTQHRRGLGIGPLCSAVVLVGPRTIPVQLGELPTRLTHSTLLLTRIQD